MNSNNEQSSLAASNGSTASATVSESKTGLDTIIGLCRCGSTTVNGMCEKCSEYSYHGE